MDLFFKINHIPKPYPVFINRVIIIVYKKIFYDITSSEAAAFIKRDRKFTIPCAYPYYIKIIFIFSFYKLNKFFTVSFFLILRVDRNILYFYNIIPFLCYNTLRLYASGSILKKWTHKVTIYYNKVDTKRRYLYVHKQQRYSL